ncbi:hypothetical protein SORBI_3003G105800 [Sorghum bicolor]|uniref:NAC domain-containing protein n=1 Tax=Sorghum bicolor TaxID=4558 RepID=A0A1W0VWP9_SORBI|nr:hypothetical protein SORBI_3003G105800 [Sorghum bicolor]
MTIDLGLAASAASSSSGGRRVGGVPPPSTPCTALPPGFRFHPTDEELILHYLRKRAAAAPCPAPVIAEVDIYKFDPWDLPAKAVFGEAEWYFFSPRDRKYPNGVRPNRAAGSGYWKATGTDKPITLSAAGAGSSSDSSSRAAMIGVKKALVFYKGRPPKGMKTSWIMHEYRLAEALNAANTYRPIRFKNSSMRDLQEDHTAAGVHVAAARGGVAVHGRRRRRRLRPRPAAGRLRLRRRHHGGHVVVVCKPAAAPGVHLGLPRRLLGRVRAVRGPAAAAAGDDDDDGGADRDRRSHEVLLR